MTIDAPNPNGFVLYIVSEGDLCEVSIDAGPYMILDAIHGDLTYSPPQLQKIGEKKKRSADLVLKEQLWLNTYTMNMHGGEIVDQTKDEDLDESQFIVHAPTGNHVKITIVGQGKMALMALGIEESFPIAAVSDNVLGYDVGTNQAEIEVYSPGPEGFVVAVMSNYTEVKVNIDGMGKIIPCISHGDDHAIDHRSSASHSQKSSIQKREEFRGEVHKLNYIQSFEKTFKGAQEIDCEPGIDLEETQQILVYAATGTQIKCEVEGDENVSIIVMERDSFPLMRSTKIISSALNQFKKVSLITNCPGVGGMVCYFVGKGQLNARISSGERSMIQIAHPK
uniref:Uncharacterized protein n=1 Tax=Trepomonas sp. PC1 TaxID=1076344 RepID=A0A146KC30_9EUKA|eukprot:JAP94342.1 Hypothetical protein TPC1_13041 [Trepomonas sp. PC1]